MAPKTAPKCKVWAGGIRMHICKKLKAKGKAKASPRSSALKRDAHGQFCHKHFVGCHGSEPGRGSPGLRC
eukprot:4810651-Lingulodinium_polyedra.AAC.1